jgi:hypothetical protein
MAGISWEHASEARAALNAIVSDPEIGVSALSSAQMMSNLLKDLLPDAPREKSILVAAAEAGMADSLRENVAQGMDPSTAVRLAASSLASSTPFTPEACSWVADELAIALGISQPAPGVGGPGVAPVMPGQDDPHVVPTQIAPGAADFVAGQAGPAAQAGQPTQAAQGDERPTVQGYIPPPAAQGYQAQPGAGQAYPQSPGQGYQQAAGPGYQQQAPPPGFGQPQQAGGWQQGPQYGPGAGYSPGGPGYGPGGPFAQPGPRRPGGARRIWLIVGGAAVGVVVLLIVIGIAVSGGNKPSNHHHGGTGNHTTPPPTNPPTTPATAIEPLRTIIAPPGHAPVGNNCTSQANTNTQNLNAATLIDATFCATSFDPNIKVWGYQFDNYGDYLTGLSKLNNYAGFSNPGTLNTTCPQGSDPRGRTEWWAKHNPLYTTHRPNQILECFTDHVSHLGPRSLIIWTLPTQDVIFVGEDTLPASTSTAHYLTDVWWVHVAYA